MNKKLLSLVIVGILTVTSLPAVTTSAAEINSTKSVISTVKARSSWQDGYILPGTDIYSEPYSDRYYGSVQTKTEADIQYYGNGWYKVYFSDQYFYVYGRGHLEF
ncbi:MULTISPECIES: hypothetical protein [Clostridium]|uniref:Bacteriocin n=1 Tax=Clostridium cibarium TaxID=2762247 RepID=A0ABR8PTG6_9CLOT|nr:MULTISPECIES: hypothetical protein [Clostridium]MBD7911466.1 hypothetical protein [Clostridium cibarium]